MSVLAADLLKELINAMLPVLFTCKLIEDDVDASMPLRSLGGGSDFAGFQMQCTVFNSWSLVKLLFIRSLQINRVLR